MTAHADLVWDVVADLAGDSGVPPFARRIESLDSSGHGSRRRLIGADGFAWLEECTEWKPEHRYTMTVVDGDFPVHFESLRYSCVIEAAGTAVRLRLYFDYVPRFGMLGRLIDGFTTRRQLAGIAREVLDHWVRIIHIREWAHRVTVSTLLDDKGWDVYSVEPEQLVSEAADLLRQQNIGSVMVLDKEGKIAGVVSERDIVRGLSESGVELLQKPVSQIMTTDVIVAGPHDNMMMVMSCMSNWRVRHLPVVEDGRPLGVISIGDVVKARISELEGQSETLRDFIEARRWHELYREVGPAAYTTDVQDQA